MELLFLGTSAGAPTRTRNVSACALRPTAGKGWYLVDCGEATQHRLLASPLTLLTLEGICLTHVHGDHIFGLPGLLSSAQMAGRTAPLSLLAPAGVREYVETALRCSATYLGYPLDWISIGPDSPALARKGLSIETVTLSHRVPSYAYCFTEAAHARNLDKDKLHAAGIPSGPHLARLRNGESITLADGRSVAAEDFLLPARRQRRIIIAGDNDSPELLAAATRHTDVLVHEATFTQAIADKVGPVPQHSSAAQIAAFAESVGLPNLVLTHFSGRYNDQTELPGSISEIGTEAAAHYHGRVFLARDYACYTLDANGILHESTVQNP
jgi:ribonuclease Z